MSPYQLNSLDEEREREGLCDFSEEKTKTESRQKRSLEVDVRVERATVRGVVWSGLSQRDHQVFPALLGNSAV